MNISLSPFRLAILALLLVSTAEAQEQDMTDSDRSGKKQALLEKFAGRWTTATRSVTEGGDEQGEARPGKMHSRMLGPHWVVNEYEADVEGTSFQAIQRFGYDPDQDKVTGTWADSLMSYEWQLEGEIDEAGSKLLMEADGPDYLNEGQTRKYRDVYEFRNDDLIISTSEMMDDDGKWVAFMKGEMKRVRDQPKTRITPFLMFEGNAEEAMKFYSGLFPDSRTERVERYGANENGKEGTIKQAAFSIAGQRVMCIDSPIKHGFTFTPSVSLFVDCETEKQLDKLFAELSENGEVMMPPDNYGFSQKFAWVSDRFGVSWQLNLPDQTDEE